MDDLGLLCDDGHLGLLLDRERAEEDRDVLAWLVEAEILPRLMLAHRSARSTLAAPLNDPDALAALLLNPEPFDPTGPWIRYSSPGSRWIACSSTCWHLRPGG